MIALVVSIVVVHALEKVDVEEHEREMSVCILRHLHPFGERIVELVAVEAARQGIDLRFFLRLHNFILQRLLHRFAAHLVADAHANRAQDEDDEGKQRERRDIRVPREQMVLKPKSVEKPERRDREERHERRAAVFVAALRLAPEQDARPRRKDGRQRIVKVHAGEETAACDEDFAESRRSQKEHEGDGQETHRAALRGGQEACEELKRQDRYAIHCRKLHEPPEARRIEKEIPHVHHADHPDAVDEEEQQQKDVGASVAAQGAAVDGDDRPHHEDQRKSEDEGQIGEEKLRHARTHVAQTQVVEAAEIDRAERMHSDGQCLPRISFRQRNEMPARAVAVVAVLHRAVFVKELAVEPQANRLVRRLEEQARAAVPLFGQTRCQIDIARLARKERLCGISHTLPSFSAVLRLLQKLLHFSLVRKVRALPIVHFRRLSFLFSGMLQGKSRHLMGIREKTMRGDCRQSLRQGGGDDKENSCERKNAQKVMRRSAPPFPQHRHAPPSRC